MLQRYEDGCADSVVITHRIFLEAIQMIANRNLIIFSQPHPMTPRPTSLYISRNQQFNLRSISIDIESDIREPSQIHWLLIYRRRLSQPNQEIGQVESIAKEVYGSACIAYKQGRNPF